MPTATREATKKKASDRIPRPEACTLEEIELNARDQDIVAELQVKQSLKAHPLFMEASYRLVELFKGELPDPLTPILTGLNEDGITGQLDPLQFHEGQRVLAFMDAPTQVDPQTATVPHCGIVEASEQNLAAATRGVERWKRGPEKSVYPPWWTPFQP